MNFFIKGPSENSNIAELWSTVRLPFQAKGYNKDMRDALIEAIFHMNFVDNSILRASYHSEVNELCDLENILLYNLESPGVFKKLCKCGISLERSINAKLYPTGEFNTFQHYQRYELISQPRVKYWNNKRELARWHDISLPKLTSNMKPHEYWKAIKESNVSIANEIYYGFFGIDIEIEVQERSNFNLVSVVKPMLDGIIAGFHAHQGEELGVVSERLAQAMSLDAQYIANLLMDKSRAVLGMRNLLHPHLHNVQWNPADDRCVAINIICNKIFDNKKPRISGSIFVVDRSC